MISPDIQIILFAVSPCQSVYSSNPVTSEDRSPSSLLFETIRKNINLV